MQTDYIKRNKTQQNAEMRNENVLQLMVKRQQQKLNKYVDEIGEESYLNKNDNSQLDKLYDKIKYQNGRKKEGDEFGEEIN